jgi:hypothetical protein
VEAIRTGLEGSLGLESEPQLEDERVADDALLREQIGDGVGRRTARHLDGEFLPWRAGRVELAVGPERDRPSDQREHDEHADRDDGELVPACQLRTQFLVAVPVVRRVRRECRVEIVGHSLGLLSSQAWSRTAAAA